MVDGIVQSLIDRAPIRAQALVNLPPRGIETRVSSWLSLFSRLPTGLVHAERIWIVPKEPPGLTPLAPGSAWYAMDRSLVLVAREGPEVTRRFIDLAAYTRTANWLQERMGQDLETIAGLLQEKMSPEILIRWAERLEMAADKLQALDAQAPGIRTDIAWMAKRGFDPEIRVHGDLSPRRLAEAGRDAAEALLARVPAGRFWLALSDTPAVVDLLSPYAVDLGHALYQWALENPEAITLQGLVEAVRDGQNAPERGIAAQVAVDLLRDDPELQTERRQAEATQGLWLHDGPGGIWGHADLADLDLPDTTALAGRTEGTLGIVSTQSAEFLVHAVERLLESGRIEGAMLCASSSIEGYRPGVADALVTRTDAVKLEESLSVVQTSETLGIPIHSMGVVSFAEDRSDDPLPMRILGRWRRAKILGELDVEARLITVFHQADASGLYLNLRQRLCNLDTARLGLAALLGSNSRRGQRSGKIGQLEGVSRPKHRFRA